MFLGTEISHQCEKLSAPITAVFWFHFFTEMVACHPFLYVVNGAQPLRSSEKLIYCINERGNTKEVAY